jgi:hypothetical protein
MLFLLGVFVAALDKVARPLTTGSDNSLWLQKRPLIVASIALGSMWSFLLVNCRLQLKTPE